MSQFSFFDFEDQLNKIHQLNDFLCRLNELIDWTIFLEILNQVRSPERSSHAGRPLFDVQNSCSEKSRQPLFTDSAYKSKEIDAKLQQRNFDPQSMKWVIVTIR
jgi:hypothetical protein